MRFQAYRLCMLVGAAALVAVALYYFINYAIVLDIALDNSGVRAPLAASIRALWLAFACQALLIGLLYALVASRPRAVSREVIVLFGMLQLLEAVLLFTFSGNAWMAYLLVGAAACVMLGAILWPSTWPPPASTSTPAPDPHTAAASHGAPIAATAPDLPAPAEQTLLPGSSGRTLDR